MAEPIRQAVQKLLDMQDFGYPWRDGGAPNAAVARAFARHVSKNHAWEIDPGLIEVLPSLDQAILATVLAYSEPGEGVLVQTPCYPPMREAVMRTGRQFIAHPLRETEDGFVLDIDSLDDLASQARMILLCNPQNPTGHVFTAAELRALADSGTRHNLVVVSDEVHADLVYRGNEHRPIGRLNPTISARTVTMSSPCKAFNTPGLRCGVLHFGSTALQTRFENRFPKGVLGHPSVVGIDAAIAAWEKGQEWLDRTLAHLDAMRRLFTEGVKALPGLEVHLPDATFLAWVNCSDLGLDMPAAEFFLHRCGVATMPGEMFDPGLQNWVRFNFGTSAEILDEMLARIGEQVRQSE